MNSSPKVTVLMPVYNGERFIRETIDSILAQTFTDFEFIIVNDESTDNTVAIVNSYQDQRIRLIDNTKQKRIVGALNAGLEAARGEYIARMDADDVAMPNRLAVQVEFMDKNPEIGVAGSWVQVFGAFSAQWKLPTSHDEIVTRMLFQGALTHPATIIRKSVLAEHKLEYEEEFIYTEDYDLWLRMAEFTKLANIPQFLLKYRMHTTNVGVKFNPKQRENVAKLHQRQFAKLGLHPVDGELNLHESICAGELVNSHEYLEESLMWFESIAMANAKSQVYDQQVLLNELSNRWFAIYAFLSYYGSKMLLRFIQSELVSLQPGGAKLITQLKAPAALISKILNKITSPAKNLITHFKHLANNSPLRERNQARSETGFKLAKTLPEQPKIGFAVLAHNRPEYLELCLDSLFRTNLHDYDITFLIQDDGSDDPKVKDIINKPRDPKYKIERYFTEKGHNSWAGAFNKAVKKLMSMEKFDVVGTCDSDAIFHPEWLDQTMKIATWAKANHKDHVLGPFSSFNSSDFEFHRVLGSYASPFGNYVVKERMGAVNYLYYREDLEKLGFFEESKDDETLMTERFKQLKVRNFCTETSYVDHIGHVSVLNQWRPVPVETQVYGMNLAGGDWGMDVQKFRTMKPEFYYDSALKYRHVVEEANERNRNLLLSEIKLWIKAVTLKLRFRTRIKEAIPEYYKVRSFWKGYLKELTQKYGVKSDVELQPKTVNSDLEIDILIPVIEKDLETLPFVIDSAREFIRHPIGEIIIISPESELISAVCKEKNCRNVNEDTVLPITIKDVDYFAGGLNRRGWLFQQFLKMSGTALTKKSHYLLIDSDTVFIRPQVFERDSKLVFDFSDEYNVPYFTTFAKILGYEALLEHSFVSHHTIINQQILQELKDEIEAHTGMVWYEAIIKYADRISYSGFAEYETYGQYMFRNHREKIQVEYWYNLSLRRWQIKDLDYLKKVYNSKYKSLSFHSYND